MFLKVCLNFKRAFKMFLDLEKVFLKSTFRSLKGKYFYKYGNLI